MAKVLLKTLFIAVLLFSFEVSLRAQLPDASSADGNSEQIKQRDLPETMRENLAKLRIKSEEKEYRDLLSRSEEAAKLGAELELSLESNQNLTPEDLKKLDRLEKVVKKIRNDLGAAEEDNNEKREGKSEKPSTTAEAIKSIREDAANLLSEIKKIGRHTISVIAIKSSNSLLNLVRFLRFNKN